MQTTQSFCLWWWSVLSCSRPAASMVLHDNDVIRCSLSISWDFKQAARRHQRQGGSARAARHNKEDGSWMDPSLWEKDDCSTRWLLPSLIDLSHRGGWLTLKTCPSLVPWLVSQILNLSLGPYFCHADFYNPKSISLTALMVRGVGLLKTSLSNSWFSCLQHLFKSCSVLRQLQKKVKPHKCSSLSSGVFKTGV